MKTTHVAIRLACALAAALLATSAAAAEFRDCPDCPVMVTIPAGRFVMGTPQGVAPPSRPLREEQPAHTVRVKAFALGKFEVTQAEWLAVMGSNPSKHTGDPSRPVDSVSWVEAQAFVARLSERTGQAYRLPTEAEWEYAARAGGRTTWSFGSRASQLPAHAWFRANSEGTSHPVGLKRPNRFGLHDMHGNVWEWVQDCYLRGYAEAPRDGSAARERAGCSRANRGGSWRSFPEFTRAAARLRDVDIGRLDDLGVRVARALP